MCFGSLSLRFGGDLGNLRCSQKEPFHLCLHGASQDIQGALRRTSVLCDHAHRSPLFCCRCFSQVGARRLELKELVASEHPPVFWLGLPLASHESSHHHLSFTSFFFRHRNSPGTSQASHVQVQFCPLLSKPLHSCIVASFAFQ